MKSFTTSIMLVLSLLLGVIGCWQPSEVATDGSQASEARLAKSKSVASKQSDRLKDLTVKGECEVRDGILHFRDVPSYFQVKDRLQKLPPAERVAYTRKVGFTSQLDLVHQLASQLEQAPSQEVFNQILQPASDLFTLEDNEIRPLFAYQHAHLLNRQGIVYIGKVLYRFTSDVEIVVTDGDIEKARQAINRNYKNQSVRKFFINGNMSVNGRVASSCQSFYDILTNPSNRRGKVETKFQWIAYLMEGDPQAPTPGDVWYGRQYIYTKGTPYKKNFIGNWITYSTWNNLSTAYSFDFTSSVTNNGQTVSSSVNYTYTNNWDSIDHDYILNESYEVYGFEIGDWGTWTSTLHEASPKGYYQNGGLEGTVYLKCP